ncbi:hypothetical protein C8R44DRAFT_949335 [Mycena epipterygia]|nr:hypothetical protein C8R44DRAFT_949335 [Mycena epipterygia]
MFAVLLQKTKCAPPGEVPASMFTSFATLASVGGEDARPYLPELMPALVTGLADAVLAMPSPDAGQVGLCYFCPDYQTVRTHVGYDRAVTTLLNGERLALEPNARVSCFLRQEKIINSLLVPYRLQHLGEYNHMKAPPNVVYAQLKYMWAQGGSLAELRQLC